MLQKQHTDTIGFVVPTHGPRFSDPFFSEILAGIGNQAAEEKYDLLVSTHAPGGDEMEAYQRMVLERRVDGVLVVRTRHQDPRLTYLLAKKFPVVAFGQSDIDEEFPYVEVDGRTGMYDLTRHLIGLGHSRIACVSPALNLMFASRRLEGYREALESAGISYDPSLVIPGTLTERSGHEAGNQLLASPKPPSAIMACNDLMAIGVISAARRLGLSVGQNLAVTGFDDVPLAEHVHPPLTTVRQPIYEIGKRSCAMLIELLQHKALQQRHVILKPELIIRESCGAQSN